MKSKCLVKMTRADALARLKATRQLSTEMLDPLGIRFESFLRFSQLSDASAADIVTKLILKLESEARS